MNDEPHPVAARRDFVRAFLIGVAIDVVAIPASLSLFRWVEEPWDEGFAMFVWPAVAAAGHAPFFLHAMLRQTTMRPPVPRGRIEGLVASLAAVAVVYGGCWILIK